MKAVCINADFVNDYYDSVEAEFKRLRVYRFETHTAKNSVFVYDERCITTDPYLHTTNPVEIFKDHFDSCFVVLP